VKRPIDGLVFHRPKATRIMEGHSVLRRGKHKLMLFWTDDRKVKKTELYDLSQDIGETHDLSEQMPDKTAQMKSDLLAYLNQVELLSGSFGFE